VVLQNKNQDTMPHHGSFCFARSRFPNWCILPCDICHHLEISLKNKKKDVPSAESSSRSVQGLGKGVSGKPYPRLCNARRPRLEPGTFRSQAVRLYRLHQAHLSEISLKNIKYYCIVTAKFKRLVFRIHYLRKRKASNSDKQFLTSEKLSIQYKKWCK